MQRKHQTETWQQKLQYFLLLRYFVRFAKLKEHFIYYGDKNEKRYRNVSKHLKLNLCINQQLAVDKRQKSQIFIYLKH